MTSAEKQKLEYLDMDIKNKEKDLEHVQLAVDHTKQQREEYAQKLDTPVIYTNEEYMNGIAKIMVPEAEEYYNLSKTFPVHPFVSGGGKDWMVERLKEKNYSEESINEYKKKREKLKALQSELGTKYGARFSNMSDMNVGGSHAFLNVGHGNHYFDGSLMNQPMKLGELLDKEEGIKKGKLEKLTKELEELNAQKEALAKK